jgi:hypothetical protein
MYHPIDFTTPNVSEIVKKIGATPGRIKMREEKKN